MKNYYEILGVSRTSHLSEIRKSYRKKALEVHPDKNNSTNAKEEFIELNEAYSVLKHLSSKVRYDKLYDHFILHKPSENESNHYSRKATRKDVVNERAKHGKSKAKSFSNMNSDQFEKRTNRWALFDGLTILIEFIGTIIQGFV